MIHNEFNYSCLYFYTFLQQKYVECLRQRRAIQLIIFLKTCRKLVPFFCFCFVKLFQKVFRLSLRKLFLQKCDYLVLTSDNKRIHYTVVEFGNNSRPCSEIKHVSNRWCNNLYWTIQMNFMSGQLTHLKLQKQKWTWT